MRWIRSNLWDIVFVLIVVGGFLYFGRSLFGGSAMSGWSTDFENISVPLEEVISGGVGRDGIPPIDNPSFDEVAQVSWLQAQEPVISLDLNGDARAYPLGVLTRHEIVNDEIGDIPVAVTFCPLCNSAIVYDRRVDGETLRFGVSGNLRNSDLIMWDNKTDSWWQQLTGIGIAGDYNGVYLDVVPSQVVGFGVFAERYPDGKVLSSYGYGRNSYVGYDSNPNPFLFRGSLDRRLFAVERVLAGIVGEQPIAYPFSTLELSQVINDTIDGVDVVVFWQAGAASALDNSEIASSRDVGMAVMFQPTVDGQMLTFRSDNGKFRDNETDSQWNIFGEAINGELAGMKMEQVNAFPHFWFSWAAFHPDTLIYEA